MKKTILFIFLTSLHISQFLNAQSTEFFDIPISIGNAEKTNAWAGGLDNPQFSEVDLNDDGIQDLYIFDRTGNVHLTFLRSGDEYFYAPEFIENFPELKHFCLLRDYDGDGIQDIFAHAKSNESADGLIVYKGKYTDGKIDFDRFHFWNIMESLNINVVPFPLNSGSLTNLYVPSTDIPDVNDIDGDGDLDVIAFDVAGAYAVYYKNQSVEEGYGLDSLIFEKDDNCWGKFYESSFSEEVTLSDDPNMCALGFNGGGASDRHAGSTTTSIDLDNDGDRELLVGDIINPKIFMLVNGGDAENAWITDQDNSFPSYDEPVFIPDFVSTFILDVDADGLVDMIASPNANNSPNYEAAWFYKNTGTNAFPDFTLQQKDFLIETMIDFGSGTHPAFADVNGDGLLDLVVGTYGYNLNAGLRDPRLFLFLNTGTANSPSFNLVDEDWLGFAQYGESGAAEPTWSFAPNFGDLDSDGDLDLVVGEYYGTIFYAENEAGAGQPMEFNSVIVEWQNLDVGLNSVPQIVDLNRDGLADLVIGERNGNTNFMKNIGTPTDPLFAEEENQEPNIPFIGEADAAFPGEGFGHSSPFFYDFNGEWVLYLGTRSQGVLVFDNINPDDLTAPFSLINQQFGEIGQGQRTHPVLADLTSSEKLELIIGNFRGGLVAYGTNLATAIDNVPLDGDVELFPNPAQAVLQVNLKENFGTQKYQIVNTIGQIVRQGVFQQQNNYLSLDKLSSGIYFIHINGITRKFVKE